MSQGISIKLLRLAGVTLLAAVVVALASCGQPSADGHRTASDVDSFAADSSAQNVALMFQGNIKPADNDMATLEKILATKEGGYNFRTSTYSDVTSKQIIETIKQKVPEVGPNGTLFLFLAGHGSPNGWLQTYDNSMINYRKIEAAIREVRPTKLKRLVIMIFSCYGGQWINQTQSSYGDFTSQTVADAFTSQRAEPVYEQLFIMTAANDRELSYFNSAGSFFIRSLAKAFESLRSSAAETATMRDLFEKTKSGVTSSHISYRAVPEELVMNEKLLGPTGSQSPNPTSLANDIFVNLMQIESNGPQGNLLLSAPQSAQNLLLCTKDLATCKSAPSSDLVVERLQNAPSGRAFFVVKNLNIQQLLGRSLHLMAVGADRNINALRSIQIKPIQ